MSATAQNGPSQRTPTDDARAELALEHEKVQIERERLALERERWAAEREKLKADQHLLDRAAGRVRMGFSTLTLALLVALLTGGTLGAWIASSRGRAADSNMAHSLIQALSSDTNTIGQADSTSPLWRALGWPGRRGGGYLLILD